MNEHHDARVRRTMWTTAMALALGCAAVPAVASEGGPGASAPSRAGRADGRTAGAGPSTPLVGEGAPAARVPAGAEDRGAPRFVWAAASPGAERPPSAEPVAAARWHATRHAARYGVSDAAVAALVVHHVHRAATGATLVWMQQRFNGHRVYPGRLSVLMDGESRLVALGGQLHEAPAAPGRGADVAARADDALALAVSDLHDAPFDASMFVSAGADTDDAWAWTLAPGAELATGLVLRREARTRPVWFPTPGGLVRAWYVEVQSWAAGSVEDEAWAWVIGAHDGAVLLTSDLIHDGAFRVWATDDLRPRQGPQDDYLPHPTGTPSGPGPAFALPALVTLEAFNTNPAGGSDPWLAPGATALSGNNVDVYLDLAAPNGFGAGDLRPAAAEAGVFDALYDTALAPGASDEQLRASAQPLFHVANWLHDWYYDAGFVEAAGNAQASNFGRGGFAGDPVVIEGQDYATPQGANMLVPGDGASPRLQVGNWPGPGVERPGALDASIVGHEWLHHLHLRLVYCLSTACLAESEGWSDFLALHMLRDEHDALDGTYAIAIYAARLISANAAYFGARRYPYSRDPAKNPLTLRHIGQDVPLPSTAPRNPYTGGTNNEVHRAGEVWATLLWQAYMELLADTQGPAPRLAYDDARRRMSAYAVTAMMLAPVDPSFIEQRDALLAAAQVADLADQAALARGFAARGAGTCAVGPARESTSFNDVVEGYDVAPVPLITLVALDDDEASCDGDGVLDAGEVGRAVVRVVNLGAVPLAGAVLTVASDQVEISFPEGDTLDLAPVPPLGEVELSLAVALSPDAVGPVDAVLAFSLAADGLCDGPVTELANPLLNFERLPAGADTETVELDAAGWGVAGSLGVWERRRLGPGDHAFHGADGERPTRGRLVSPPLTVAAGASLVLTLRHAYSFESDASGPTPAYYDGGVVEFSRDGGASWQDVASVTAVPYPGHVVAAANNPLSQRAAFVGESADYPALHPLTVDLGGSFGGQTIRLAFTVGTDAFAGAPGWLVDDVHLDGLAALPFDAVLGATAPTIYLDGDGDGFGAGAPVALCPAPAGHVDRAGDCDDSDDGVHPDAAERCNANDDDCDGATDEGLEGCGEPGPEPDACADGACGGVEVEIGPEAAAEPGPEAAAEPATAVEAGPDAAVELDAEPDAAGDVELSADTAAAAEVGPDAGPAVVVDAGDMAEPVTDTCAGDDPCDAAPAPPMKAAHDGGCTGGEAPAAWAAGLIAVFAALRRRRRCADRR